MWIGLHSISPISLLSQPNQLGIEAPAGYGKTSFTKYLAKTWASCHGGPELVILIPLRDLLTYVYNPSVISNQILAECLVNHILPKLVNHEDSLPFKFTLQTKQKFIDKLAYELEHNANICFILDGLDEVRECTENSFVYRMREFLLNKPNVIITSRPGILTEENIQSLGLLSMEQRDEYLIETLGDAEHPLIYSIKSLDSLKDLSRIPLYLELLCKLRDNLDLIAIGSAIHEKTYITATKNMAKIERLIVQEIIRKQLYKLANAHSSFGMRARLNELPDTFLRPIVDFIEELAYKMQCAQQYEFSTSQVILVLENHYDILKNNFSHLGIDTSELEYQSTDAMMKLIAKLGVIVINSKAEPSGRIINHYSFTHRTIQEQLAFRLLLLDLMEGDVSEKLENLFNSNLGSSHMKVVFPTLSLTQQQAIETNLLSQIDCDENEKMRNIRNALLHFGCLNKASPEPSYFIKSCL